MPVKVPRVHSTHRDDSYESGCPGGEMGAQLEELTIARLADDSGYLSETSEGSASPFLIFYAS